MGDGQYLASATYSGTGSGSKVTGYTSTATYWGEVTKSIPESVTYKLIYEGIPIPPPPFDALPLLYCAALSLLLLLAFLIYLRFRRNARVYALDCGRYKLLRCYRTDLADPFVDLTHPHMAQYTDFMVIASRSLAKKLTYRFIEIILPDKRFYRPLERFDYGMSVKFHVEWGTAAPEETGQAHEIPPDEPGISYEPEEAEVTE